MITKTSIHYWNCHANLELHSPLNKGGSCVGGFQPTTLYHSDLCNFFKVKILADKEKELYDYILSD